MEIAPTPFCSGTLYLWRKEIIVQGPCKVDEYGDISVLDGYKEEIIDVEETVPYCELCGLLTNEQQLNAHSIHSDWTEIF